MLDNGVGEPGKHASSVLRQRGYSDEAIRAMTPAKALKYLCMDPAD